MSGLPPLCSVDDHVDPSMDKRLCFGAVRFDPCALLFLMGSDTFLKELQVLHELFPTLFL